MPAPAQTRWSLRQSHRDKGQYGAAGRLAPLRCAILLVVLGAGPALAADEPQPAPEVASPPAGAGPDLRPAAAPGSDVAKHVGEEQIGPDPGDFPPLYDTIPFPQTEPGRALNAFPKGTFWRVEKDGGVRGYVLGTLHIGELDRLGVPEEAFRRLAEAKALVVEISPNGYSPERAEALRSLPAGTDLRALVGEESYALAERLAREARLDGASLMRMQPWAALALLQAISHLPERSLDDVLIDRAREVGLEIIGLESIEEQFGAFNCAPAEGQALVMRETLSAYERFREINDATIRLYRDQDLQGLMSYLLTSVPLSDSARAVEDQTNRCLIDARNELMAERLGPLLDSRILFVAIGALHLTGPDGVLARLERRGYRVVPGGVESSPAATRGAPDGDATAAK
jgi:hypothetical protein